MCITEAMKLENEITAHKTGTRPRVALTGPERRRRRGTIIRITDIKPGESSPMHRTESIDYGILLDGELYLVLDDGRRNLRSATPSSTTTTTRSTRNDRRADDRQVERAGVDGSLAVLTLNNPRTLNASARR